MSESGAMAVNPTGGQQITLRELVSGLTGGSAGTSGVIKGYQGRQQAWGTSLGGQLQENLMMNAVPLAMGVIGIPVAARVITKLIRKPVILPANRMLKNTLGLDVKV
jgi:hypothetical protein